MNEKKYALFNKQDCKVLSEEEVTNFLFNELFNYLIKNTTKLAHQKQKRSAYRLASKHFRNRKKLGTCFYLDCKNKAIQSHSISEKSILSNLANKTNLLLTPNYKPGNGQLYLSTIGIKDASIFPGFCDLHDNKLFEKIDNAVNIEFDEEILYLINFRTYSREIFVQNNTIFYCKRLIEQFNASKDEAKKVAINNLNNSFISSRYRFVDFTSDNINLDDFKEVLNDKINSLNSILYGLLKSFNKGQPFVYAIEVDKKIPVALSGIGVFKMDSNVILTLINVLPFKSKTVLIISCGGDDKKYLDGYLSKYNFDNDESILKMIETWITRGTDNWFISPEYWNELDEEIKRNVLEEFSDFKSSDINIESKVSFLKWDYQKGPKTLQGI